MRRVHQLATEAAAAIPARRTSSVPKPVVNTPEPIKQHPEIKTISNDEGLYWPPLIPIEKFRQTGGALLVPEEFDKSREELRLNLIEQRKEKFRLFMDEQKNKKPKEVLIDSGLEM